MGKVEQPQTFQEYKERHPDVSRLVESYESYGDLTCLDRGLFWNEELYSRFQQEFGDNPMEHEGVRLLFRQRTQEEREQYGTYASGAANIPAIRSNSITAVRSDMEEVDSWLERWISSHSDLYETSGVLIAAAREDRLGSLSKKEIDRILGSSLYHFHGILLAYRVGVLKSRAEELKHEAKRRAEGKASRRKRGKTAQDRFSEWKKAQGE